MDIFTSVEYQKELQNLYDLSYKSQIDSLDFMRNTNKCIICHPTGVGKSYIGYGNMLESFVDKNIFVTASHRLMLNSQHLTNMFKLFRFLAGHIGFIFVGSDGGTLTLNKKERKIFNNLLKDKGLNERDLIKRSTSDKEIKELVDFHLENNRKVVIVSTYHSLGRLEGIPIDTIYCDEAHLLATPEQKTTFKTDFKKLTFEKSYFFTATPRDSFEEDTDAFLMNNKDIFGERFGLQYRDAIDLGLIVKPIIHLAIPTNYDNTKNFGTIANDCRFVIETFDNHKEWVKECSISPNLISPKLLIKCRSVDDMWSIYKELIKKPELSNAQIFAGASNSDSIGGEKHKHNGVDIQKRQDFLKKIKKLKFNEDAIVLHYDIFSEGIDVPGLTGTMFLVDNLPTKPKILQNIGRSTRLNDDDRELLKKGIISTLDYSKWIKPHCAVILPIMDINGEYIVQQISEMIKGLRDRYGFDPNFYVSEGNDLGKSIMDDDTDDLNEKNKKSKVNEMIKQIRQEIEKMDANDDLIKFGLKVEMCQSEEEMIKLFEKEFGI